MATKKPTPAEPEAMVRLRALTPLRYDGQDVPETFEFEMNSSAAEELVLSGLAEFVPAEAPQA
jgi:hypothetical protein